MACGKPLSHLKAVTSLLNTVCRHNIMDATLNAISFDAAVGPTSQTPVHGSNGGGIASMIFKSQTVKNKNEFSGLVYAIP